MHDTHRTTYHRTPPLIVRTHVKLVPAATTLTGGKPGISELGGACTDTVLPIPNAPAPFMPQHLTPFVPFITTHVCDAPALTLSTLDKMSALGTDRTAVPFAYPFPVCKPHTRRQVKRGPVQQTDTTHLSRKVVAPTARTTHHSMIDIQYTGHNNNNNTHQRRPPLVNTAHEC